MKKSIKFLVFAMAVFFIEMLLNPVHAQNNVPPGDPFQALQQQINDLQNQINNSVGADQMCPDGSAVVGFTDEGVIVCRMFTAPVECPCWNAESLDENARELDVQDCVDSRHQTDLHSTSEDGFIANATIRVGDAGSCQIIDYDNEINILYNDLTELEVNACREILLRSTMWRLNCSP